MRHITVLIWDLAGRPRPAAALTGGDAVCVMCGRRVDATAEAASAIGTNFTDQYLYRRPDSDRICAACVWCCSGKPPATLRMWSIAAAPGLALPDSHPKAWLQNTPGLCLTNRADPTPLADLLLDPPGGEWAASIAVSGQKHVLPYGRVNRGAGEWTIRMETTDVSATPQTWRHILGRTAALRHAGHSAEHVREGAPDPRATRDRDELHAWRDLSEPLTPYLRSPLIDAALWCCVRATIPRYRTLTTAMESL